MRVGPKFKEQYTCKKREHREGGHVTTEAESRVMKRKAKDCQQPPRAAQDRLPSRASRRNLA